MPWEDLWYAVRGGGGGSYGIVVGLTYQLHERRALRLVELDKSPYDVCDQDPLPPGCKEVNNAFIDFWIDLLERGAENKNSIRRVRGFNSGLI